jgi:2-dehydro-3-deoxyphosphogluconate aldolase/(4S)-4-hydroxy-2-oxoglutarate aldolase
LEVALTTPSAIQAIEAASKALPDFRFGLGTVLDVDTARLGILAGAKFIVTPAPRAEVITLCRRYQITAISGALNESDIATAFRAGADAVKVFPGEQFGPAHLSTLRSRVPDIPLLPIGGVTPGTITEFIRAGALAAFAGSSLIEESMLRNGNWNAITERALAFRQAIESVAPFQNATVFK